MNEMKKILFVNHKEQKCGVYEFGKSIGEVLTKSRKFNFVYREADSWDEFCHIFEKENPGIIIYNYHPTTMGWIGEKHGFTINSYRIPVPQIGIIHEVTQKIADNSTDIIFDYHIAADPTLLLKNPIVYKTGRLVPRFDGKSINNRIPNIGSFGFATNGKGFVRIIEKVQEEFDEAVINLNISFSKFLDEKGDNAKKSAALIKSSITKKGIDLNISHEHLTSEGILNFLSKNDLNVFFYDYQENRGISSVTDWAIAVKRPLAITRSSMFRHLFDCYPSICIEDNSLKTILQNGVNHLEKLYEEWSPDNLLWDYERIVTDIINKNRGRKLKSLQQKRISLFLDVTHIKRNIPLLPVSNWLKRNDENIFDGFVRNEYQPIDANKQNLNRILDNNARKEYESALDFLKDIAPEVSAKKIQEANIQQAFVFDTVFRLVVADKRSTKILSLGAFEDTAAIALKKLGFDIEFVDPTINYDLSTFITKPSTKSQSYDIVFATSVIEHVENDEQFIEDIAYLLKIGGFGILTCDFEDNYRLGDDIPNVDFRFYTKKDLTERLLKNLPNCRLEGKPNWECKDCDFVLANKYKYTFASFVFRKMA